MSSMAVTQQVNHTSSHPRLNQREWIAYSFLAAGGLLITLLLVLLIWYALPRSEYLMAGKLTDFPLTQTPIPFIRRG
jgi:hypothetical protein